MSADRAELLADLADLVNELVDVRHHAEVVEVEEHDGPRRRRVRRRHIQTLPSLLDSLTDALEPAPTGDVGAAGYESRPAAELEPLAVLGLIQRDTAVWCRALGVQRDTLPGRLRGLVSARHTDSQLANLVADAHVWARRARLATGWEAADFTLDQPCPSCWGRNVLRVAGDLDRARCRRCGTEWDETTVGLLGQILTQNAEHETLAVVRCASVSDHGRACARLDEHDGEHRDTVGHYWHDPVDERTA